LRRGRVTPLPGGAESRHHRAQTRRRGVARKRTALAEFDRDAAATCLVGNAGWHMRLLQLAMDGAYRRRERGFARLAVARHAASGGPRADAAFLAGIGRRAPLVRH